MSAYPQQREMAPDFVLPSATGGPCQLSTFRGRRNLVLVFAGRTGNDSATLLMDLVEQAADLEFEETRVLAIVRGSLSVAETVAKAYPHSFLVLADAEGVVHDRYAAAESALVVTDRYGEIYSIDRGQIPDAKEVMASLRHINAACLE